MTGPLASDIRALRVNLACHTALDTAELAGVTAILADLEERADALEDFAALRSTSGSVVRLRPVLTIVGGGKQWR